MAAEMTTDPIALAGREAAALYAALDMNQSVRADSAGESLVRLMTEEELLQDKIFVALERGADRPASSVEGALFQIMVAYHEAACILEHVPNHYTPACEARFRRLQRCLYSALAVVADDARIDPASIGAAHLMPERMNPHILLRMALGSPAADMPEGA